MKSNTTADTAASGADEGGSLGARIRREGDLASRTGQMGRLYDLADEADTLRAQLEAAEAEVERWHQQSELHKHMVITCGVAATHSDPNLTLTGAYKEKWNSQQADSVRALRARAEAAEADAARYLFLKTWGREVHVISTEECNFGVSTPTWRGPWLDLDAAIDAARTKAATP